MTARAAGCVLCEAPGGAVLWRDAHRRIVRPEVEGYPGFLRVIHERHIAEMTDLPEPERAGLMRAVFAAESALRAAYRPVKVNLASYGNQVPHLHWHVVARFADDPHYPEPAVGAPRREGVPRARIDDAELGARLAALLGAGSAA